MRFIHFVPAVLLTAICGFPVAVDAGQETKTPPAVRTESTLNIQGPPTDAAEVVPPRVQVPAMVKPRPFPARRRNIVPRNQNRPVTHRPDGTTVTGDVMEESKITQASSAAQAGLGLQADVPNPLSRPFSAHPLNFGGLSVVGSPQLWPYSPVVKIFMHFPTSGWFACSGSMVEASHVLTAGHCVFDTDFGEWADQFIVFPGATGYDPAWSSLVAPVGAAGWTEAHSFSGWTLSGDLNYDIGMIDTDRTVGALSGWYGFGYNDTCSFYLNNTFFTPGYPGESPYDGTHMYTRAGVFDECDADSGGSWFGNDLVFYGRSYHGQSGSSQTNASSLIAYGVLSNGDDTFTDSPRILSSEFSTLLGNINDDTPTSVDIVAMGASGSSSAAAGSQVGAMSYVLYNNSTASVSTTYSVSIYLSTNNFISTSDRLLQTHNVTVNLGARSGIRANVSSLPVIPGDVGGGSYWLGVIVNAADANTGNNASSGDDAMPITVTSASCYPNCPRHDFNADGRSDLLWRNTSSGALAIWMMNGTSPTNVSVGTVSDLNWKPVAIGDFDGDGKADILWRNTSTGATAMWLMNGATIVANVGLSVNPSLDWIVAGVGDFDHDGRADILW
ncbi:MAG: hypothetical protein JWN02_1405, partial [Acidobacteria bacterium]|nr:hypothetical protein [Acidobacteriota bacterium]